MKEREVCGSYPGACPWGIYSDEPAAELAARLAEGAGCDGFSVDGVWFPAAGRLRKGETMTTNTILGYMTPTTLASMIRDLDDAEALSQDARETLHTLRCELYANVGEDEGQRLVEWVRDHI